MLSFSINVMFVIYIDVDRFCFNISQVVNIILIMFLLYYYNLSFIYNNNNVLLFFTLFAIIFNLFVLYVEDDVYNDELLHRC